MTAVTLRRGSVTDVKKFALMVLTVPVSAALLAGCAHDPTVAGKIDGQSISIGDVTTLGDFICATSKAAEQQGNPPQIVPRTLVNERAVTLIAGARLLEANWRKNRQPVPTVSPVDVGAVLPFLTPSERPRAQQLFNEVTAAFNAEAQNLKATEPGQVMLAIADLIQQATDAGHYSANPAYPPLAAGLNTASGSLSQAVSGPAKAAMAVTPGAAYVGGLSASQKCG